MSTNSQPQPASSVAATTAAFAANTTRTAWLQSIGYYGAFIAIGLSAAILGPTLDHLAEHTGSTLSTISWAFSANAGGRLFGGLLGGRLYDRIPGHPTLTVALLMIAVALAFIPIAPVIAVLFVLEALLGLAEGTVDAGCNTLLVWVHGDKVGPFMNALHFMFGLGTFIIPFIIVGSLTATGDVQRAYWMVALLMLPVALFVARQPSPASLHQGAATHATRSDKPFNAPLTITLALFFYLIVAGEGSLFGWVFNFGKALSLNESLAAQLSQVFFGAFTVGRLLAIPIAMRLSARMMLLMNLVGCVAACVVMGIGTKLPVLIWLGTGLFGLCVAPLFASTLSFAEQHIKITGRMTGIFLAVSSFGIMTAPPLIGQFFETFGPITVPIVVGSAMLAATIVFAVMLSLARKRPDSAST